jgi:drug/metabolite transporter (DMT)-like permease
MSDTVKAHVALFLVALIYGANYSIAKEVMGGGYLKPLPFILLRVITGVTLFFLFQRAFVKEKVERRDYPWLALCGLFGVALNQMLFFSGLNFTTPINASLIMTTTPILVLIASSVMIGERITRRKVLGILLGAAGAILLISYGHQVALNREGLTGDLLIFGNATAYGIYLVLVRKMTRKYHPITVVRWVFSFGFLYVLPFGAGGLLTVQWHTFPPAIWLAVGYVLLCTTFLAYLFNAYALRTVEASVVSIYIYLQPLLATLIALLLAKDQLDGIKVISAVLIFAGVYLVGKSRPGTPTGQAHNNKNTISKINK